MPGCPGRRRALLSAWCWITSVVRFAMTPGIGGLRPATAGLCWSTGELPLKTGLFRQPTASRRAQRVMAPAAAGPGRRGTVVRAGPFRPPGRCHVEGLAARISVRQARNGPSLTRRPRAGQWTAEKDGSVHRPDACRVSLLDPQRLRRRRIADGPQAFCFPGLTSSSGEIRSQPTGTRRAKASSSKRVGGHHRPDQGRPVAHHTLGGETPSAQPPGRHPPAPRGADHHVGDPRPSDRAPHARR